VRVAIVSYYAPPEPAVASHRVLRLSRTLLAHGHEVHWVTLAAAQLLARDDTLAAATPAAVVRHELGGPTLASRPAARNLPEKLLRTLTHKLPGWLALPDKHLEWAWRLRRELPALARREGFDAVLLTCGPHGQILAIPALRRACPRLRILVDYRDLLSGNAWTRTGGERVRQRLLQRERAALRLADQLFVNTSEALREFEQTFVPPPCPVQLMRNAADYALADELADELAARGGRPTPRDGIHLGFFGTIFPRRRLRPVLDALALLDAAALRQVTVHVYCDARDSKRLLEEDLPQVPAAVRERVMRHDPVPFATALQAMREMTALLLVNGSEPEDAIFVPGKLYDYLMARRPVLFVGNPGDAWQIVADTSGPGHCFTYAETAELAGSIAALAPRPGDLAPARQYDAATSFAPLLTCLEAGRDPGAAR